MKPQIARRPQALADLAEIWGFIAEDSEAHADAFADKIDSVFQSLAGQPMMGRTRPELGANLRSFPVGCYVIFYLPLSNGIDVVRVLHGARDVESQF
jgi:toxin ParE1/3/4